MFLLKLKKFITKPIFKGMFNGLPGSNLVNKIIEIKKIKAGVNKAELDVKKHWTYYLGYIPMVLLILGFIFGKISFEHLIKVLEIIVELLTL